VCVCARVRTCVYIYIYNINKKVLNETVWTGTKKIDQLIAHGAEVRLGQRQTRSVKNGGGARHGQAYCLSPMPSNL